MKPAPKLSDIRAALKADDADNSVSCPQPGWYRVRYPYSFASRVAAVMATFGIKETAHPTSFNLDEVVFLSDEAHAAFTAEDR